MTSRSSFLTAAGCTAAAALAPAVALAQQRTPLRVAGVLSDSFGEPFFAKAAGAFERAGFDLDVTTLANAGAIAAAIGGGALEIGIGDLISGINAIVRGVPVLLLAGSGMYISSENSIVLAAAKDGPIRQPRDLTGKSIGVPTLVGLTTACVRAWLPANGVPLESVKIVEISTSAAVPAVLRGQIDCALIGEPFITPYKNDIRDIGHPLDVAAKEFTISVWYGSKAWIEADPARARRALNAIYETGRWCNSHHDETFAILVRDAHFDGDKLKGMLRTTFATGPLTPAQVQPVLNVGYQVKIFDRQLDANTLIAKI
jgi:NitT/TauT family transport system substrate-binding protein